MMQKAQVFSLEANTSVTRYHSCLTPAMSVKAIQAKVVCSELREKTRTYVSQARELGRASQAPEPLLDSPKCPKCSLLAICMPHETRFLRERQARAAADQVLFIPLNGECYSAVETLGQLRTVDDGPAQIF